MNKLLQKLRLDAQIIWHIVLAAPLSIVLHEIGHAFTAFLVGYSRLYITYHSWGGTPPAVVTSLDRAWMCAGGPIASFLIVAVSYLFLRKMVYPNFSRILGLMASIQFTGALTYVLSSIIGVNASTVYDSARVAGHLNTSIFLTSTPGSIVIVSTWILFVGSIEKDYRGKYVWNVLIGALLGFLIWLTITGPILLPD